MPTPSAPAVTTWRENQPYHYKGYVYLLRPRTVFAARVNQSSFTYPLAQVTYDTVTTGAFGDIRPEMTVFFGTTPGGDELGRQRIRAAATSTVIKFGRSPRGTRDGEVNLQDDAYITVLAEHRPFAKIPKFLKTGANFKDEDLTVGTRTTNIPPVANGGVPYIGFVDPDTNVITVTFTDASFANSGSIASRLWAVGDGTITVGTSSSSSITATFPPGYRYVYLTATDTNGQTHTTAILVVACEKTGDNAPLYLFDIPNPEVLRQTNGHSISFRVKEDLSDFPRGGVVIYFEDEQYGDTAGSLTGPTGREHVKFFGWENTSTERIRADETSLEGEVTIECLDIIGKLATLPGFTQVVTRKATPANWQQMSAPTIDTFIDYILRWGTNALDIAPFTRRPQTIAYPVVSLSADKIDPYQQVSRLTAAVGCVFTCDKRGHMRIKDDPQLQDAADRTTAVMADITITDYKQIDYDYQPLKLHWLHGGAVVAGTNPRAIKAVFCDAPGASPGQGAGEIDEKRQLVISQTQLNKRMGHFYARTNAPNNRFTLQLTNVGDLDIDPALMEWVQVTITPEVAAQRGLSFTQARMLVHEVSIRHYADIGSKDITLIAERETVGLEATTYTPPPEVNVAPPVVYTSPTAEYPQFNPPDIGAIFPPSPIPGDVPVGWGVDPFAPISKQPPTDGSVVALWDAENLDVGFSYMLAEPTWQRKTPEGDYALSRFMWELVTKRGAYLLALDTTAWSHTFDFEVDDGGFVTDTGTTQPGTWLTGQGWEATLYTANRVRQVVVRNQFGLTTHITSVSMTYNATAGEATEPVLARLRVLAGTTVLDEIQHSPPTYGTGVTVTLNCDEEADTISFMLVPANGSGTGNPGGSGLVKSLTVTGTGVNPFGASGGGYRVLYTEDLFADQPAWSVGETIPGVIDRVLQYSARGKLLAFDASSGLVYYSNDYGATWGGAITVAAAPASTFAGDAHRNGQPVTLLAADQVVRVATSAGGAYSDEPNGAITGQDPVLIHIPVLKFGSKTVKNKSATQPEYLLAPAAAVSGDTLWKVLPSGKVDITPGFGVVNGPDAAFVDPQNGARIVALMNNGSSVRFYDSGTAGVSWSNRGTVDASTYIRMRLGKGTRQVYLCGGTTAYYVPTTSGTLTSANERTHELTGTLLGIEPYG